MDNSPGQVLSNDLWARVLSLVAENGFHELRSACYTYREELSLQEGYHQLHSMRLVCKKFDTVFKEHPELSARLFLGAPSSAKAFMSLLEWLQRDSTVVQELVANCGIARLEATLSGAIVAANKPFQSLKRAMVHKVSDSAATMLALCTNLTSCHFGDFYILDLEPLQALPNLSELSLHTGFRADGVGKLAKLTDLELDYVNIDCDGTAEFVHSLKRLSVSGCTIERLHDLGIAACSGLQRLSLIQCCIPALSDQYALDMTVHNDAPPHPLSLTRHLSDLMQLTSLQLFGLVEAGFERPSVFLLTNLVGLDLSFCLDSEVTQYILTDQLGVLHSLEHFAFSLRAPKGSTLTLEVSWHLMPRLQTVNIAATRSIFDERILGFAKLTALKTLELDFGELGDDLTAFFFGFMMYNMAAKCPQVDCRQKQLSAHDILANFDKKLQIADM